jgi:deoxyribose-phosphate aldolase
VCVAPAWVASAAAHVAGSATLVASTVAFPHGNSIAAVKAEEAKRAIDDGAREVDFVINIGHVKSGRWGDVEAELRLLVRVVPGMVTKAIIETALLGRDEKSRVCRACREAGVRFVKTSTGFGPGGATVDDVALMRGVVGGDVGVKAAGGIRTTADAIAMLSAGASRLGCSASIAILAGLEQVDAELLAFDAPWLEGAATRT